MQMWAEMYAHQSLTQPLTAVLLHDLYSKSCKERKNTESFGFSLGTVAPSFYAVVVRCVTSQEAPSGLERGRRNIYHWATTQLTLKKIVHSKLDPGNTRPLAIELCSLQFAVIEKTTKKPQMIGATLGRHS